MFNIKAHGLRSFKPVIPYIFCCLILSASRTDAQETPANSNISLENARVLLLTENINSAVIVYAQLLSKDSLNVSLNSEYAYALALNGFYDAALRRFDRIRRIKPGGTEPEYFASQVFALMGSDMLAAEFRKDPPNNKPPVWVASKAPQLLLKYKRNPADAILSGDQVPENFKRANRLTSQGSNLQALALFDEIITQYPDEYLPYVGYSIALEKSGLYQRSVKTIETAINIIGHDPLQNDTKLLLDKRLTAVKQKIGTTGQNDGAVQPPPSPVGKIRPMMVYAGGMISSSYASINGRYGYFVSETGNAALDFGLSSSSTGTFYNLGFSYYQRHKFFVAGFGINAAMGNNTSSIFGKLSVGLSFMSKKGMSSWDIFWDGLVPFSKSQPTTIGFSVGRSVYFGKRK
ncbi:MAG: hypothetical protein WAL29_13550 [Bacteroidales bacterium]